MSWLLKVLRSILFCGQEEDEPLLIRHEVPAYPRRPLFQTTAPSAVSHPYPTFANPSRSSTALPSAGRSTQLPPARPPPVSYSSSASANPLTTPIPSPSPAQSTKPQAVAYPSSALANQSKNTPLPSKAPLLPGQKTQNTRLPAVAQSSPSLANPSSTTLPSRATASPVPSTRAQLAKPPPQAYSPPSLYNTSSTTPSQSKVHSSLAPTSEASLQFLKNWKPKQVVLPFHPLKTWRPGQSPELLETKQTGTAREEAPVVNRAPPIALVNPSSTSLHHKAVNRNTPIKHLKSVLPRYEIPQHLKEMIERDIVPPVLFGPLTPSTYADYFACLLYAEDYYIEKWSDFLLSEVTLELRSRAAFQYARGIKSGEKYHMNKKDFVAFRIHSVPERLPFLLSRDFVFVRPSVEMTEPFKGILFRVVKGVVLVEFEDDFHAQHSSTKKYDVSFSFNRVCLKRAHHAVSAAKDPSLNNILFPEGRFTSSFSDLPPSSRILNHKGPLPYILEGPLSTTLPGQLSNAGYVIQDAILKIYRTVPLCRILICAPRNRTCDALMRSLQKEIPHSKLFRANAAFRDYELVPDDIIPACLYEGECFTCPPLSELRDFKVVMSTFMSSFRLHNAGITSDHFTHIFLVDASSATEPEAIVALVDLVCNKTSVVVTGSSTDLPHLMRSDIGRKHGVKSYFKRLLEREPYSRRDPKFITHL